MRPIFTNPYPFTMKKLLLCCFFLLVGNLSLLGQQRETVTYKTIDTVTLSMEVVYPPDLQPDERRPGIVFFFGGGWVGGTLKHFAPQAEHFAKRGLICFLVDYRVAKRQRTSPFESLKDAKSAMRFVRKNADRFQIYPDSLLAGGGSAGGHLAAATAMVSGFNETGEDTTVSCRPQALLLFNPVVDNGPGGYGFERVGDAYKQFSPLHNIKKGAPPTLFMLGTEDPLIPVETGKYFQKMMERVGSRCDLALYEGQPHGFFNLRFPEYYRRTLLRADSFLVDLGYLPPLESAFTMPAEYEEQAAVWLGWSERLAYERPFLNLAKALSQKVPVKIISLSKAAEHRLRAKLAQREVDTQDFHFYTMPDNRLWMRDHGAAFLRDAFGRKKVADFGWTLYGYKDFCEVEYAGLPDSIEYHYQKALGKTGQIDSLMGAVGGLPSVKTDVNMEGGSIEVNGKGTLILCEAVTMQRNPDLSKEYIESEFKRVLGVSNIIWMKEGLVEDPLQYSRIFDDFYGYGTYGHTDEFVRFVNDSTLLLAWVPKAERKRNKFDRENYRRMSENLKILEQATDQDGKPFTIIKVPLPDPLYLSTSVAADRSEVDWRDRSTWKATPSMFRKDQRLPVGAQLNWVAASSYLNYLVTNNAVILPTYVPEGSSEAKEAAVKAIFERVFPNRELIFLEVMELNYFGGGIHCITQQEPK